MFKKPLLIIIVCGIALLTGKTRTHFEVGINKAFPPYEFLDNDNKIKGANIDILKAIGKDTGFSFDYIADGWCEVLDRFDKEELQIVTGMIKTPQTESRYLFCSPHDYIQYSIFTRRENAGLSSIRDLSGKCVWILHRDGIEDYLTANCPGVSFLHASDYYDVLEKLSIGMGDAAVVPRTHGYVILTKLHLDNLIESTTLGDAFPSCIALPLGYEEAQAKINKSLEKLSSSYRLKHSQSKWFGVFGRDFEKLEKHSKAYKTILYLLILGLVIISFFIIKLIVRIRQQKKFLDIQNIERNNYEKEFNQRHQLFVTGPMVFLKWNDIKREMFDSISDNFSRYGYSTTDLLTGKLSYRNIIHPDDLDWVLTSREHHLNKKEFNYYQIYRIICPAKVTADPTFDTVNIWHNLNPALAKVNSVQIRWIYDYTVAIPDELSNTYHFYGYLLDITQHKVFENDIMKQHQAAQIAMTIKDIFLTNISVEINSPLNALIGLARKTIEKTTDEDQKTYLKTIIESAMHLKRILQQIHDFLSILKGSIGSIPQWYILRRLVEPIITEYRIMISSKQLAFEYSEYQPTALVRIDSDWFQKITRIVLDNAVKFTETGKIELSADVKKITESKGELHIKVTDTGIGIPQDKIDSIMEPFTQADETYTRRFGGIGLGLSIARNLLVQMNGVIKIVSQSNKGTTVELHFPVDIQ